MPNGKPGDAPWTDFFVHKRDMFPEDMTQMLRTIYAISPSLLKDLAHPDMWDWEQGENLDEGRRKLRQIMAENGIGSSGAT